MTQKTYALFDLIGIKAAISAGKAAAILERFWSAADAWTNSQNFSPVFMPEKKYRAAPDVYVCTFSDSALLYTHDELEIDDFLDIVRSFKRHIENNACSSYAIISRNDEIVQPEMPAIGGHLIGTNMIPRYVRVAGSGNAWINLHRSDTALHKHKEWHNKYLIFCVGKQSCPRNTQVKDSVECVDLINAERIYALE